MGGQSGINRCAYIETTWRRSIDEEYGVEGYQIQSNLMLTEEKSRPTLVLFDLIQGDT